MKEDIKQFYDKLESLERDLEQERNFLKDHNYMVESMCINDKLEMLRIIKINYSLFFDGTFTIDQIDLKQ